MRRDELINAAIRDEVFVGRFWAKVPRGAADECWEWAGWRKEEGYGAMFFSVRLARRRHFLAHRMAWAITHGAAPEGRCVLHRCDNPPCCNPAHLFLGTRADNNADKHRKGRQATSAQLSPYTEEDVRRVRRLAETMSGRAVSEKTGIPPSTVQAMISRTSWRDLD